MLAYDPGVGIAFNIGLTALSLLAAAAVTTAGLAVAVYVKAVWSTALGGGIVGAGVACMHFMGMQALELPGLAKLNRELSREVAERKKIEAQRLAALEESEMLLREVHHRVKNNLQVVSSLLRLHSGKVRDPAQLAVFTDCRDRIHAMALIHERLYTTGKFARIEFGGYLAEMVRMTLGANSDASTRVRLDLQLDPLEIPLDTAMPLSLIASELVLNALKHAFPGARPGTLTVKLRAGEPQHELVVQDDGPGRPAEAGAEPGNGVGIELVESLTRQIRGERHVTAGPGGTAVTIRWPAHRATPPENSAPDHTTAETQPHSP